MMEIDRIESYVFINNFLCKAGGEDENLITNFMRVPTQHTSFDQKLETYVRFNVNVGALKFFISHLFAPFVARIDGRRSSFGSNALTRRSHTHGSDNSIYSAPGIITNFIIISFAINRSQLRCAK